MWDFRFYCSSQVLFSMRRCGHIHICEAVIDRCRHLDHLVHLVPNFFFLILSILLCFGTMYFINLLLSKHNKFLANS